MAVIEVVLVSVDPPEELESTKGLDIRITPYICKSETSSIVTFCLRQNKRVDLL